MHELIFKGATMIVGMSVFGTELPSASAVESEQANLYIADSASVFLFRLFNIGLLRSLFLFLLIHVVLWLSGLRKEPRFSVFWRGQSGGIGLI